MRILGVDPGISTGLVIWDTADEVVYHMTVRRADPSALMMSLAARCDYAVIESVPKDGCSTQARRYGILLSQLLAIAEVIVLAPSEWKPFAKAQKWHEKELSTVHEQDAYCMTRYAYKFKIKENTSGES